MLPVLEDANSIQVALMQIMRLLVSGQIEGKTAGLLLYALQTASANLRHTTFEPFMQSMVLDPSAVRHTPLGANLWDEEDFISHEEKEEKERAAQEKAHLHARKKAAEARELKIRQEKMERERAIEEACRIDKLNYDRAIAGADDAAAKARSEYIRQPVSQPATSILLPEPECPRRPPSNVTAADARRQVSEVVGDAISSGELDRVLPLVLAPKNGG
jgi:hypothetical protein